MHRFGNQFQIIQKSCHGSLTIMEWGLPQEMVEEWGRDIACNWYFWWPKYIKSILLGICLHSFFLHKGDKQQRDTFLGITKLIQINLGFH